VNAGRASLASHDQIFAQALSLHGEGRLDEAERLYLSILAVDSRHVASLLHLGVLRLQQGRYEDALELIGGASRGDLGSAEARANLGTALHLLSRNDEAIVAYEAALVIDPDRAEAHYGLGVTLQALRRHDEAIACHERALSIDPDYAEASCGLGAALAAVKRFEQAIGRYQRALDVDPDYVEAICGVAEAHHALKRYDDAIAGYRRAIAIRPEHAPAHSALGNALQATGRHAEALDCYRKAFAIKPDYGDAHVNLGSALEELGRIEEAQHAFERAIAIEPRNIRYNFALIASRRVREGDPSLAALETWQRHLGSLADDDQILFHFGLGKALSDIGRHEQSFRHLLSGNAIKRRNLSYHEAATLAVLDRIRTAFDAALMRGKSGMGHPSAQPIFIVGMPRSGSTLVEQVLASHPRVFGAGERSDFDAAVKSAGIDDAAAPFPESCALMKDAQFERLGADYLDRLGHAAHLLGAGTPERITDKMLGNFCYVGLIHLALPNARIIHTRRDPIDTCLSCFSKLFAAEQPFAYDLGELGRYYRAYESLMEHWRGVVPPGVVLDVRYEELVADFELQARRIVAHCGLEWDPACLAFYKTERLVRTASVTQVRQPIYQSSVGRWRPSAGELQPLLDGLGIAD
jgi:tetratricopeptide (TPR) repeat protein